MLRVGLIGCGEISVQTAKAIQQTQNVRIAATFDVVPELAEDLATQYGAERSATLQELLGRQDVDAVIISTPHYLHAPLGVQAAQAGKHVLVEKPIATTLADADRLIAACADAGVALSVFFCSRNEGWVAKAKELLAAGAIGEITAVTMSHLSDKPLSYWSGGYSGRVQTSWRRRLAESGGGFLIMNLVHNIDRLRYITGLEVKRVYAEYDTFATPDVEVEDFLTVALRYENGAIGSIEGASVARGRESFGDRIYGTEGTIVCGNPLRVFTRLEVAGLERNAWTSLDLRDEPSARAKFLDRFAEAISAARTPDVTGEDGRAALEIICAAYLSGRRHAAVELPLDAEPY